MAKYVKNVFCGEMNVDVLFRNGVYSVSVVMSKFGDCSAYVFISDEVGRALNSGEDVNKCILRLKSYSCKMGNVGCIASIAECLEEFFCLDSE